MRAAVWAAEVLKFGLHTYMYMYIHVNRSLVVVVFITYYSSTQYLFTYRYVHTAVPLAGWLADSRQPSSLHVHLSNCSQRPTTPTATTFQDLKVFHFLFCMLEY